MKKRIRNTLIVIATLAAGVMGCSVDTKEDSAEFTPTPLVIETQEKVDGITGYYKATISVSGEGVESFCYEGPVRIDKDGEWIHITGSDLVRSNFDKLF